MGKEKYKIIGLVLLVLALAGGIFVEYTMDFDAKEPAAPSASAEVGTGLGKTDVNQGPVKPTDKPLENKPEEEATPEEPAEVQEGEAIDQYLIKGNISYANAPSKGKDRTLMGIPKVIDTRIKDDKSLLVLVNKEHAVSKDYTPKGLVTIDNKYTMYKNMQLKKEAYEAYKKLYKDAKALGYNFKLCSTMRSYDTQRTLYNNSLKNRGRKLTNLRSAYPGRSEHHTGLALDITSASIGWGLSQDFAKYEDGKWLNEHCQDYGFILRYPADKTDVTGYAYEPWHFRYVGVEIAKDIMARDLTLEEYLEEIQ